ncbi:MAG: IclR helix-turn-helix domain protein [Syntrophus sp. PtaB.Bin001]|nr:MAG: IclR helix-turn-helix domain protein [Syntrophus sp. PtaB.Bin001]
MAAKSCRKIELLLATDAILNALQETREPLSITELSRRTGLSIDNIFRQVGTMADLRWVEKIGDGYVLGMRLAVIWARRKSVLEGRINKAQQELSELTGGN